MEFFPAKVTYEKYTLEHQPDNAEWFAYFSEKLDAYSGNTPLIFVESWLFDWNKDGIKDALVSASNTLYSIEDNAPNPPYNDNTATYTFSTLFISGQEPLEIISSADLSVEKEPPSDDNDIYLSYLAPESISAWFGHFVSAIQFDENGNLMQCPIFNVGEYDRETEPHMLLCDIDGDGEAELITLSRSIYSPIIVYKLIDGTITQTFRMTTPA